MVLDQGSTQMISQAEILHRRIFQRTRTACVAAFALFFSVSFAKSQLRSNERQAMGEPRATVMESLLKSGVSQTF